LDVHHTQISLSFFQKWHKYVATVVHLRNCFEQTQTQWRKRITENYFKNWKKLGTKAILRARVAARFLNQRNRELLKTILDLFYKTAHSRRIARRETAKFFRFKPDGPFTPVNVFYANKRVKNIRALHHHYVKSIPPIMNEWHKLVLLRHRDNDRTAQIYAMRRKSTFRYWEEQYKNHFHARVLADVRRRSLTVAFRNAKREKEGSDRIEKTMMLQLIRDRHVFNVKLGHFNRLSENHSEAVLKRRIMRNEISTTTNDYFKRHEELQLFDFFKQADEVARKTREVRLHLAEGFLYHLGRVVRGYDNQVIAHQFCLAFRILCEPIVERAVGYFCEKRLLKNLLMAARHQRDVLRKVIKCAAIYHRARGWSWWRQFTDRVTAQQSEGLMEIIRRRTEIMQRYPYFNWTETLPVKAPLPLKEVEQMFKGLPAVSLQRKLARARQHHLNTKVMLNERRTMRDFFRAFAGFVQTQQALRTVLKLLQQRQALRITRAGLVAFLKNWKKGKVELRETLEITALSADIEAWMKHFFRERARQQQLLKRLPYS
jgi:hypothetical protein